MNLVTSQRTSLHREPRHRTMNLVTGQWTSLQDNEPRQWTSLQDNGPRYKTINLVTRQWTSSKDNEPRHRTMNLVTRQWTSSKDNEPRQRTMNLVTRQWTSSQDNEPRHKTMNLVTRSPGGVPWTQKLIESPSAENPELSKVPSVKAWSRLEYSFACLVYCQEVCLSTPGQSTSFSLELSKVPLLC